MASNRQYPLSEETLFVFYPNSYLCDSLYEILTNDNSGSLVS